MGNFSICSTPEFDETQLAQLDEIENAAQSLIDVLCEVPDYLKESCTQDGLKPHPMLVAEAVARILKEDMSCVFFPTHVEETDGTNYISDLYVD